MEGFGKRKQYSQEVMAIVIVQQICFVVTSERYMRRYQCLKR